jgi:hypothetical protein
LSSEEWEYIIERGRYAYNMLFIFKNPEKVIPYPRHSVEDDSEDSDAEPSDSLTTQNIAMGSDEKEADMQWEGDSHVNYQPVNVEIPELHQAIKELMQDLTLEKIQERLAIPAMDPSYKRNRDRFLILSYAEAAFQKQQEYNRLPAWIWDSSKPSLTWDTLAANYVYPEREVLPSELLDTRLPFNPRSLHGLSLERMVHERAEVAIPFRWAYTSDYEDLPDIWTTWALSVINGNIKIPTARSNEYITDIDRGTGAKKALATKLYEIMECWEFVLKWKDNLDKNKISKFQRPKGCHLAFRSKMMQNFDFQFRTNCEIKLGLVANQFYLEGSIADFHASIIEFDQDYLEVINKGIHRFLKMSNIVQTEAYSALAATHLVRGFASSFNQILLQETVKLRDQRKCHAEMSAHVKAESFKAKLKAHNLSVSEMIEEIVTQELARGRGRDSYHTFSRFDDEWRIEQPKSGVPLPPYTPEELAEIQAKAQAHADSLKQLQIQQQGVGQALPGHQMASEQIAALQAQAQALANALNLAPQPPPLQTQLPEGTSGKKRKRRKGDRYKKLPQANQAKPKKKCKGKRLEKQ